MQDRGGHSQRLAALRALMGKAALDAFIVPRTDVHQGEYVQPRDERLAWISGFTGSAGFCVITATRAGLFVDGRYLLQAEQQVDTTLFEIIHWPKVALGGWVKEALKAGRIGFDPTLHRVAEIHGLEKLGFHLLEGEHQGLCLIETENLVDEIWGTMRPDPIARPLYAYPLEYAGQSRDEKIKQICGQMQAENLVLTALDAIAWLLNIRGSDIECTPLAQAFGILSKTGRVAIFADNPHEASLRGERALSFFPKADFWGALSKLEGTVQIDPKSAPYKVKSLLKKADIILCDDPCSLAKACKNPVEIAGARRAHLYDGASVVRFLFWLEGQTGRLSELELVEQLARFRHEGGGGIFKGISFETIAASGANGAIVHYRVEAKSNRKLAPNDILLLDSGGQYLGGTTDITRTIAIGHPTDVQKYFFTLVLKGMMALSMARWPAGLCGRDLDALARQFLRRAGEDYDHGTGHGVGAYLSVHEGPQSISSRDKTVLQAGMILSNEPGYYLAGEFGIRIENLLLVRRYEAKGKARPRDMLEFETLTLAPIDKRLINAEMLNGDEKNWLNSYHSTVCEKLSPLLDPAAQKWLQKATEPLGA